MLDTHQQEYQFHNISGDSRSFIAVEYGVYHRELYFWGSLLIFSYPEISQVDIEFTSHSDGDERITLPTNNTIYNTIHESHIPFFPFNDNSYSEGLPDSDGSDPTNVIPQTVGANNISNNPNTTSQLFVVHYIT